MKKIVAASIVFSMVGNSWATLIVQDPVLAAQSAVQEVTNYIQYLSTQINTLNTYENQVLLLARYGNPATYTAMIPGVSTLGELASDGSKLMQDYQTIRSLTDPARYRGQISSIMAAYQLPNFSNMTSPMGVQTTLDQASVQFQNAQYQAISQISTLISGIETEKQNISNQLATDTQLLNSATDQSAVGKYQGVINALHAEMTELNGREQQLLQQSSLLVQQVNSAKGIYGTVQSTQAAGIFQNTVETGMIPTGNTGTPQSANAMITSYGYPSDYTPDSNSSQGIGAFSFDTAPGSLVPLQSAALTASAAQAYGVSPGQSFTVTGSNGQTYNLVYADVVPSTYNGQSTGNRVDIYDPNGVLGGNNFSSHATTISTGGSIN